MGTRAKKDRRKFHKWQKLEIDGHYVKLDCSDIHSPDIVFDECKGIDFGKLESFVAATMVDRNGDIRTQEFHERYMEHLDKFNKDPNAKIVFNSIRMGKSQAMKQIQKSMNMIQSYSISSKVEEPKQSHGTIATIGVSDKEANDKVMLTSAIVMTMAKIKGE